MNDKLMLELAAKAIGLKLKYNYLGGRDANQPWNPLEDDGDALRLAVKLEINIQHEVLSTDASVSSINCGCYSGMDCPDVDWAEEPVSNDPYAATRRAITRAAAEIGMAL